jgi:hypothetical protein
VEQREAGIARGLLQVPECGGEVEIVEGEREIQMGGERTDEPGVGKGGFAAEVVVDVEDVEGQVPAGSEFAEDVEEADGIGAPGHGDGDTVAGGEHAMALDGVDDEVEQDDYIVGPGMRSRGEHGGNLGGGRGLGG